MAQKLASKIVIKPNVPTDKVVKASKPKTQFKVEAYEKVITEYLENPSTEIITTFVADKFRNKDISYGTVCDARLELFSLMIYLEGNERYNKEFRDTIAKVMECMYVEGKTIKYRL